MAFQKAADSRPIGDRHDSSVYELPTPHPARNRADVTLFTGVTSYPRVTGIPDFLRIPDNRHVGAYMCARMLRVCRATKPAVESLEETKCPDTPLRSSARLAWPQSPRCSRSGWCCRA